jgi:predicted secreted protein
MGGGYPDFDDCHWKYFPESLREEMEQKYKAGHHRRMQAILNADYSCSEELADIRDEYNESVREFRNAACDPDATYEEKRVLMHRMMELERELTDAIRNGIK